MCFEVFVIDVLLRSETRHKIHFLSTVSALINSCGSPSTNTNNYILLDKKQVHCKYRKEIKSIGKAFS